MPQYKVTVVEYIPKLVSSADNPLRDQPDTREVFSQTLEELNLPSFIRALNPATRKRRGAAKKEGEKNG